jgi:hypothetical protein
MEAGVDGGAQAADVVADIVTDIVTDIAADITTDFAAEVDAHLAPDVAPDQRPVDAAPVLPASCSEAGARIDPGTGHCYFMLSMAAMVWPDARAGCDGRGAHLATLTSPGEQAFAVSLLDNEDLWIGLYQIGTGALQWVTGEPVTFMAWAPLEPDEIADGRARLSADGWHDTDERRRYLALCERDP